MKRNNNNSTIIKPRNGCKDVWNAYMCEGAKFTPNDIPLCPTTAVECPKEIILWDEAKHIFKTQLALGNNNFHYDAFISFYMDDYKFDGIRGIWHDSKKALETAKHFSGIITPDFSTYQDFPEPIKIYNTYRMRAFGFWAGKNGLSVINNVRWGSSESYRYCFDGIDHNSIISIGTVGGSPRKLIDRDRFNDGFVKLIDVLHPKAIIVYGSSNYPCFKKAIDNGISIRSYPSKTAAFFERRQQK